MTSFLIVRFGPESRSFANKIRRESEEINAPSKDDNNAPDLCQRRGIAIQKQVRPSLNNGPAQQSYKQAETANAVKRYR
jgi:hypothetical protein